VLTGIDGHGCAPRPRADRFSIELDGEVGRLACDDESQPGQVGLERVCALRRQSLARRLAETPSEGRGFRKFDPGTRCSSNTLVARREIEERAERRGDAMTLGELRTRRLGVPGFEQPPALVKQAFGQRSIGGRLSDCASSRKDACGEDRPGAREARISSKQGG
jgi:hypothetical protein